MKLYVTELSLYPLDSRCSPCQHERAPLEPFFNITKSPNARQTKLKHTQQLHLERKPYVTEMRRGVKNMDLRLESKPPNCAHAVGHRAGYHTQGWELSEEQERGRGSSVQTSEHMSENHTLERETHNYAYLKDERSDCLMKSKDTKFRTIGRLWRVSDIGTLGLQQRSSLLRSVYAHPKF